jgi:hypothetical protein
MLVQPLDIDDEVANMRDLLRQHIMLSDREEQLKPLGLGKRNKTFSAVVDGVECFEFVDLYQLPVCNLTGIYTKGCHY